MELANLSLEDFTAQLASAAPVPGGGGASALAGALGAALASMVGAITAAKAADQEAEDELRALMTRAQDLRVRLLRCVEKDAAAFEPLCRAYAIPRGDPRRDEVMERCLKDAAAVPREIFDLCGEALELQRIFAEKGSVLVISDAATGAALCAGALYGAAMNVKVNTKFMKDRPCAEALNAHVDGNLERYRALAEETFNTVYGRFC